MSEQSGTIFSKTGDRRFRGTEEAIFEVFASTKSRLSVSSVIKRAGISSSTFYRHHKSINNLLYDYECLIMDRFCQFVQESTGFHGLNVRQVVYRMLVFIVVNRKIIEVVADRDNFFIIYNMVKSLKNRITLTGRIIRGSNRIFDIYACEVCGVIKNWHENGYSEGVMMEVENDIVYLTLTIDDRLGKLVGSKN